MSIQQRSGGGSPQLARPQSDSLADLLERVLDKGVVVAGDIVVNLLDIELLTLKVRLLICSADTAQEMGIDWWKHDPFLTGQAARKEAPEQLDKGPGRQEGEGHDDERPSLSERIERLETLLAGREADRGG
jgi:hypothetical protein